MSKHNYSKDFKKDNTEPKVEESVGVLEEPEVEETTAITGVVTNCVKLNVRETPQMDSKIRCIINKSSKVQIVEEESTEEFYKVYTESGIEGYCMKDFITIE